MLKRLFGVCLIMVGLSGVIRACDDSHRTADVPNYHWVTPEEQANYTGQ